MSQCRTDGLDSESAFQRLFSRPLSVLILELTQSVEVRVACRRRSLRGGRSCAPFLAIPNIIVAHLHRYSARCSECILTVRSRTSGEHSWSDLDSPHDKKGHFNGNVADEPSDQSCPR